MNLHDLKKRVRDDLIGVQEFVAKNREDLSESNLFRRYVDRENRYNPIDVEFEHTRMANARQVEITGIEHVLKGGWNLKTIIGSAEPRQCFHNAWKMSVKFHWNYCEGFFIDARYLIVIDHAWNRADDGRYVDITGEAQPYWFDGDERFADTGAYVIYYEIPATKIVQLVRQYKIQWVQLQLMSRIEWFIEHAPQRLKRGPKVIRME